MGIDPDTVVSVSALGEALTGLKQRSGRSLSQLSRATAAEGAGGLSRSTLNGYFKGRHLPQQGVGHEFRLLLQELGVTNDAELAAWWATVERLRYDPGTDRRFANPYPGLRPFDTADTGRFFGRSALTERILARITVPDGAGVPTVVVGPSGAGKSSVLRAGVVPGLTASGWTPMVITPGKQPCAELAAQLAGLFHIDRIETSSPEEELAALLHQHIESKDHHRSWVLVVDQLEEVFAEDVTDDERAAFLTAVGSIAATVPVLLGLRADFYSHALVHAELAAALQTSQIVVGPMRESELREVITEPARTVGISVEPGLVELLLRDIAPEGDSGQEDAHEPGSLPLLSHALRSTFDIATVDNHETVLTVQAYRSTGGIHHAVADTAETAYTALGLRGRELARQVFLRLVNIGDEGTTDIRRIVDRDELVGHRADADAEDLDDTLDTLVTYRLLTASDASVQISHEALLVSWPRLREWLDDDRAGRRLDRKLTLAAGEWRDHGRQDDDLYQGSVLTATLDWVADAGRDHLNALEQEFLDASIARRDSAEASARRRVRRRYQFTAGAVVLVVLLVAASGYAWRSQQAADRADRAALSRTIAEKADRLRATDPALAAQLAVVAYRSADTVEARSALLGTAAEPIATRRHGPEGTSALVSATPTLTAMIDNVGDITLRRTGEPSTIGEPVRLGQAATAVALSPDAEQLAAVSADGTTRIWDVRDPAEPHEVDRFTGPHGDVASTRFSTDGRMLAVGGDDGDVRLRHLGEHGDSSRTVVLSEPEEAVTGVAFSRDTRTLVAGSRDGAVYRYDLADPTDPRRLPRLTGPDGEVFSVALSPDGETLAAGTSSDRAVYLWDVADPENPERIGKLTEPNSWVTFVDFSPDGERLVAGSSDSKLWQWDTDTQQELGTMPHPAVVTTAVHVGEHAVLTLAEDGIVRTWDTRTFALDDFGDTVYSVDFDRDGHVMAVGPGHEENAIHLVHVADPAAPERIASLTSGDSDSDLEGPLTMSRSGALLAAGTDDGAVFLWDVSDPARPRRLARAELDTEATIASVDIDRDGSMLAVAAKDGTTSLFDITRPRQPSMVGSTSRSDANINEIRFDPDGTRMATASDDGHAYLYETTGAAAPHRLAEIDVPGLATALAFHPDRDILAVGTAPDDNVHLWNFDVPSAPTKVGEPLDGPVGDPRQLAFRPGTEELAVASVDGAVQVWNLAELDEPRRLVSLSSSTDAVMSVAYTQQGNRLATGSRDNSVDLLPADPERAVDRICARSGDDITRTEWQQFVPERSHQPPC